jgi:hypothetical protein
MISSAPVAVATNLDANLMDKIRAFISTAKSAAADGLTWAEFGDLMLALLRLVIPAIDAAKFLTGAEKKTFALEAVGMLFDAVADRAIPVAVWPLWLIVRPAVRSLVIAMASGAVEQLLPLVRA